VREIRITLWIVVAVGLVAWAAAATLALSSTRSTGDREVWCVAPGEKVTPELRRDYPELLMPRSACDALR
jgi:beta-lactamase regulating signal transducer with metallopeptidase domain